MGVQNVGLETKGIRSQTIGVVASALQPDLFSCGQWRSFSDIESEIDAINACALRRKLRAQEELAGGNLDALVCD